MENQDQIMAANLNAATIRVNTLVDTISNLNFMIEEYKRVSQAFSEQLNDANNNVSTLSKSLKEANHAKASLGDSLRKATLKNTNLQTAITNTDILVAKLTEENKSLLQRIEQGDAATAKLDKMIEDLEKDKADLIKENEDLKEKLRSERATTADLKGDIARLNKVIELNKKND